MTKRSLLPLAPALFALVACTESDPGDALARLKPEPGPSITLAAQELLTPDGQRFFIVCPGVSADTAAEIAGGDTNVPDDGYDPILNAFIVTTSDGGVVTQRYSREEVDLCGPGLKNPLEIKDASTPLTFVKEGTQWRLVN